MLFNCALPFTFETLTELNRIVDGTYTLMVAVLVWEKRMPVFAGKSALKRTFPSVLELDILMLEIEDPRPFAVSVPLIRMVDCDHGSMVTKPSTSEIVSDLYEPCESGGTVYEKVLAETMAVE